ncbi:hematopoietic progenitor cell antigen CD34 [Lampris incognitus]|uniref:hematopoietic progenitor cell antigen CD34 n=1 Tax=Lampris incognitus TaxID=2546036 RepID=UPI0024B63431|nr:hematopoietic progenitor cell antigen CD34 [Lampris incognitus]
MAASMWRMNGLWRGVALALVLHSLLLNNRVMCQADATDNPASGDSVVSGTTDASAAEHQDATTAGLPGDDSVATPSIAGNTPATPYPKASSGPVLVVSGTPTVPNADSQAGAETSGTSLTTAVSADSIDFETKAAEAIDLPAVLSIVPETQAPLQLVVPKVNCVEKEALDENTAIKAVVTTNDCEETKRLIQANPAAWCPKELCRLDVFQEENTMLVSSPDAQMSSLVEALQGENIKGSLGVSEVETPPSSSGSSVFVAVLLTGLLLAAALIGGYCLKTRRGSDAKGIRLAEESYPVDVENQGNTLVSVAPLNPPPETQEKPTVNGDSPDEAKTQPPPTNGHSTAKTADTEL